ncbi:MAG: hypothetical protein IIY71_02715 [Oscillospiraceae bacterium]|nr:hypothetical protein [Oscillospiraceae bacterium]
MIDVVLSHVTIPENFTAAFRLNRPQVTVGEVLACYVLGLLLLLMLLQLAISQQFRTMFGSARKRFRQMDQLQSGAGEE